MATPGTAVVSDRDERNPAQGRSFVALRDDERRAWWWMRRHWRVIVIVVNFAFWFFNALHEWFVRGIFVVIGVDWSRFWGASRAFEQAGPSPAYKLPDIARFMQPLVGYYRPAVGEVRVGPAPYPPIFLKLFEVFTLPSPPVGFLLWTALSVVLALYVVRRLAARFQTGSEWQVALLLLSTFPLMMALFVGQVTLLLFVCVMQAVSDFDRGREFRAGFWTGLLVLKPQYAFCLFIVYVIKRRTAAASGFVAGGITILIGSLAVGGVGGMVAYVQMLFADYPAYAGGVAIDPRAMIGWRSLVITFFPHLSTVSSLLIVGILSVATLALLPAIWSGPWDPTSKRFLRQLTATLAITLLVAYHSQPHGATLLLVPGALLLARPNASFVTRNLLAGAVAVMPILGIISAFTVGNLMLVSLFMSGVLIALVVVLMQQDGMLLGFHSVRRRNQEIVEGYP